LSQRFGLDALTLLRHRDHRVVFIIVALFNIPLAAFYPYVPPHLQSFGFRHTTAWMSLGQVTEIIAMFSLGALLLRWRLKWIFACGLSFGVLRFVLSAMNNVPGLLAGILLHGCSFALVYITAQIYIDQRVDPAWRARAQALISLMSSGVGNLTGYLGTGAWFALCNRSGNPDWVLFWSGLAIAVAMVLTYFVIAYQGIGTGVRTTTAKDQSKSN
jgi:MFS family permease